MATLRYVGNHSTSFVDREVNPGDEFEVPDHLKEAYTRRADVVAVEPSPTPSPVASDVTEKTEPVKASKVDAVASDVTPPATPTQEG